MQGPAGPRKMSKFISVPKHPIRKIKPQDEMFT